ncbi:TetR/AcrR family transcriptional regulator [Kitasatospora sp. NPDC051914]|uniref:TetR/AcrR family transcriptional regulator n=1 Tax=Kitasatospora sp. NPDC051914 TaxID=3154945 RepID=UPI0034226A62
METTRKGCRGTAGRPRCPGKEAAILAAALTLLTQQGFTRMTLDNVARAAGVSKATIHLRWKTKTELAAAALATLRPCSTPHTTGDVRADLAAQLSDFAAALTRTGGMALIGTCLAEEKHTPELLELLREHAVLPRHAGLVQVLDQARAGGTVAAHPDAESLASALLGAFYADYLAGRTGDPGWADRVVAALLRDTEPAPRVPRHAASSPGSRTGRG